MSEHPIQGIMDTTMQKIKEMVDVNTIVGDPMTTPDGTTIIPISKVSFGFASGGADIATKNQTNNSPLPAARRGGTSRNRVHGGQRRGHPTDSRCEQCHNGGQNCGDGA